MIMVYSNLTLTDYIDYGMLPIIVNLMLFWSISIFFMVLDDYCDTK